MSFDIVNAAIAGNNIGQSLVDERRKTLAYNALQKIYGDVAGNLPAAIQGQEYSYNQQANPLKIEGLQLGNTAQSQMNEFNAAANPKKLEGLDLGNEAATIQNAYDTEANPQKLKGLKLGNAATAQAIDQSSQMFPLQQTLARAQIAATNATAAYTGTQDALAQYKLGTAKDLAQATDELTILNQLKDVAAKGGDVGQAFDQVAPHIASFGVDPQQLQALRAAVVNDPATTLPRLEGALQMKVLGPAAMTSATEDPTTVDYVAQLVRSGKVPTGMSRNKEGAALIYAATARAAHMAKAEGKDGESDFLNQQFLKGRQKYLDDLAKSSPTSAGGITRSASAVLAHMDLLDNYINDLQNGNVRAANLVGQEWRKQTGSAAPTSFDAQKIIVGDELTRYLIARGGTGEDRKDMHDALAKVSSPTQLRNVIATWRNDMVGQLHAQAVQAHAFKAQDQFESQLTPEAKKLLGSYGIHGSSAAAAGPIKVGTQLPGGFTVTGVQ